MKLRLLTRDFLDERFVPEVEDGTVQYFDHVRRYLYAQQFVDGARVLDIACRAGYGSQILRAGRAHQVVSVDISFSALDYARSQWPDSSFAQGDAMQLALADASFDVIVTFETLEHLPEPQRFLAEARRLLRPGGYLLLSTPNREMTSPGSSTPYSPYHTFEPTLEELHALLTNAGCTIEAFHGITHSPRAERLIHAAQAPYERTASQRIAWAAYLRLLVKNLLPPVIYKWLGRRRQIPTLAVEDSVLTQRASTKSMYFVVLCTFENQRPV
jgi:ubiquinone/menaquinone biosynthesis C-methylase UbiE